MKYHVMIDTETLDTTPTSVVLSVGVVLFTAEKVVREEYVELDAADQLRDGRTISADTLAWWLARVKAGHNMPLACCDHPYATAAWAAANKCLRDMYGEDVLVWANSPSFDLAMLRNMWDKHGLRAPWVFYNERDYRTWRSMLPAAAAVPIENPDAHNALADAAAQAKHMIANRHLVAF